MNLSKIKSLHVIIIGAVVCVIVGIGLFFVLIKPMKDKMATTQATYDASNQVAMQEPQAKRELDQALADAKQVQEQYAYIQQTKMPNIDFADRGEGMLQLWQEQTSILGPLIQQWPKRTGVALLSSITVPAPPVNPNTIPTELIEIPIGSIQVRGSFKAVIQHLRSWNYFNRLVKIDMPTLVGPSPGMASAFNLTVYIFPKGKQGPQIAMAGAGEANVAAGGSPAAAYAPPSAGGTNPRPYPRGGAPGQPGKPSE